MSQLDLGNYPGKPVPLGTAKTDEEAALVEARRLAEFVPLPAEIEPALNFTYGFNQSRTFTDVSQQPISRELTLGRDVFETTAPGFISGYYSEARTNAVANLSWQLNNFTLLFTDPTAAKNAVPALGDKHFQVLGEKYQRTQLENYPDAYAFWSPEYHSLFAWHSFGHIATLTIIRDHLNHQIGSEDLTGMQAKAEKVVAAMPGRLSKFTPTSREQWGTLDRDIDGMLAMTVPATNDSVTNKVTIPAVYEKHGALQISPDTNADKKLFDETGVDLAAFNGGALYRTKDPESARLLADHRAHFGRMFVVAPSPTGLPTATCHESREQFRGASPRYHCSVSFGRYAANIAANQLTDAHQRISAQYSLLANGK
ncbi:DUF7373 family lipoprotein [Nocardia sp. IBHARD005]|uniref:DUF7373 family lipoprotein n=1 Tax=Nocardia sp. IBHARD005 TaxID=3457765 RepID=UPI004059FECA